jgi:hypothetical protein
MLVPGREVIVTVRADGFEPASRKLTLAEGKVEEVTLVMVPGAAQASARPQE